MAVVTISDRQKENLAQFFASQSEVMLAYLFGSLARGDSHALSDIDIAVLLSGAPDKMQCFDASLKLMAELSRLLHKDEVDVVMLNHVPVALRYRVLRDGVLLFYRDYDRMLDFRLRTVNEYLDFKPILLRHERAVIEKARKGELFDGYNPYRGSLEQNRQKRAIAQRSQHNKPR